MVLRGPDAIPVFARGDWLQGKCKVARSGGVTPPRIPPAAGCRPSPLGREGLVGHSRAAMVAVEFLLPCSAGKGGRGEGVPRRKLESAIPATLHSPWDWLPNHCKMTTRWGNMNRSVNRFGARIACRQQERQARRYQELCQASCHYAAHGPLLSSETMML